MKLFPAHNGKPGGALLWAAPAVLAALLLAGCGGGAPDIAGRWHGAQSSRGLLGTVDLDLRPDRHFLMSVRVSGGPGGLNTQTDTGTYDTHGDTLELDSNSASVNGVSTPPPEGGTHRQVQFRHEANRLIFDPYGPGRLTLSRRP